MQHKDVLHEDYIRRVLHLRKVTVTTRHANYTLAGKEHVDTVSVLPACSVVATKPNLA